MRPPRMAASFYRTDQISERPPQLAVILFALFAESPLIVNGTPRHSLRRAISGCSWSNDGHRMVPVLNSPGDNDPLATLPSVIAALLVGSVGQGWRNVSA
jgi:hypothetical protein